MQNKEISFFSLLFSRLFVTLHHETLLFHEMKTRSLLLLLLALLASCSRREAKEKVDALPEIYPDYIGVTVPTTS